jgi:hypothetical protein
MLTAEELREQLDYNPATGVFTRRVTNSSRVIVGDVAGFCGGGGYREIRLLGYRFGAHRLAWLYVYGVWPTKQIDHINGVRSDNRIVNLREATQAENQWNRKKTRGAKCKLKGVHFDKGRFRAAIRVNSKLIHLGGYATEEEAHAAYVAAAEKEFGAFARAE